MVDLVRDLANVCADGKAAAILNRLGYRTGAGNTWTESRVRSLRSKNKIAAFDEDAERTSVTMAQAAEFLGVSPPVVRRLVSSKILPGHQAAPGAPWVIDRENLKLPAVRAAVKVVHDGRRSPRSLDCESQVQLFQQCNEV